MSFFCRFILLLSSLVYLQTSFADSIKLHESDELSKNVENREPQKLVNQASKSAPLVLRASSLLQEKAASNATSLLPIYIQSDSLEGISAEQTNLDGNVTFRRGNTQVKADHIQYSSLSEKLQARGTVSLNRAGNLFRGSFLDIQIDSFEGYFIATDFSLVKNNAYGSAEKIDFLDDKRAIIQRATYTTCRAQSAPGWAPAWILKADTLSLNTLTNEGSAKGATLVMKDFPNVPLPSLSFPLTNERKSGLLAPTIGVDNISGIQISQPYYWNIAPNRDATITPTYWSRRGTDIGTEFRYLEGEHAEERGQIYYDYMSKDPLRDRDRWGYSQQHAGSANFDDKEIGKVNYYLNLNRVSDDLYWQDFPRAPGLLSQQLLPTDLSLSWTTQNVTTFVRSLKWQTLQDAGTRITPPYDRLPEVNSRFAAYDMRGLNFSVEGDYTEFKSDRTYSCLQATVDCQPNAQRIYGLSQLSYPVLNEYGYLTPKLMLHSRSYAFESPTTSGLLAANVTVPTFSLDGVLNFERSTDLFNHAWTQTLEPRVFFVYTPFRSQNDLPVYDSSTYDFSFASIFNENAFSGNDRISDSKMVTLGGNSRLIDSETGFEAARLGVAQRILLRNQDIYLPTDPKPITGRLSDFLVGGQVNLNERWKIDSTYEYNPQTEQSDLSAGNVRYNPTNYRLLTAGYRYDRRLGAYMIDTGWQWPINDLWGDKGRDSGPGRGLGENRWYAVGRINYNKDTGQIGDAVAGFEYDAGCWLGRVVLERIQINSTTTNQRIMFQVEFDGISRVGSNPLSALKQNIPRYQNLRDPFSDASRYANYQ